VLALIPLLPFGGFLVNAFLGKRLPKSVSGSLATGLMAIAFVISVMQVLTLAAMPPESRQINQTLFTWITAGDFTLDLAFRLDALSAVMILVVTGIGSLIHLYSTSYMHEETDAEFARFFSYLNLFCFFMLMLVLGSNVLVMFVGWEGVGLCSYLLIGYYYEKPAANDAAKKAFVVNRVGDFAFILGALLLVVTFKSLDFYTIALAVKAMPQEVTFGTLSLITLLMFIGATGKSAQIPLYVWLPDAMEGPTPVSALIHAATMVTAGVYMIGRNAMLFEHAPITLTIVAIIGAATALFAGTIGLVQNDIKRVLAYSTVSQLGYMFLAMGVGAYGAGIFHLYTHAFFKACLFLGSGAVIHALHGEQDIRKMGGLKKHIPVTYWTFVIASVAIAGVPFLSGFFSKDEILFETFVEGHQLLWGMGILTSLLTATYMFRLVHLTFHGEARFEGAHAHDDHGHGHGAPHDAPWPMATALVVLALGSILAGYVGVPHALGGHNNLGAWLTPVFNVENCGQATTSGPLAGMAIEECKPIEERNPEEHAGTELALMIVSSLIALAGIGLATYLWLNHKEIPARMAKQYPGLHRLLLNKYYVDEVYDAAIVQPIKVVSTEGLWRGFDVKVVDGAVNGAGYFVSGVSIVLRLLQNGSVKTYAASMFAGAVAILAFYLWR
jgi:NADH-quinone oxidoreductase subunit L